ncbi:MAG: PP2C family protein-serine/threonine phosphatase [Kiritimatiellia bacterium]
MVEAVLELWDRLLGRGPRPLDLVTAATTDRGLVRNDNQDSFICTPREGFLCVADGMGGGEGGALASRWVCETLAEAWGATAGEQTPEAREERVAEALQAVNDRIRAHAREQGFRMMGTTVAALLLDQGQGFRARIFHAGDSRIYRFRLGRLDALTRDHTVGNELGTAMAAISSDRAKSLQARSNPLTHILTRAVGTEMRARPEWKTIDLQRGDRLLICSDGVHDMLSDAEIASFLRDSASPRLAVARIEAAVRKAGAGDNYTILCAYAVPRR